MSLPSRRDHANELVLFAAILGTYPTVALRRAAQLARERGAVLHVLLATRRAARALNVDEAIDAGGSTATSQSAALAWCRSALGCDPALLLHTGDELEHAVRDYALSYRPVLVVLAPHDDHAAWIRTFVTRTRVAVLVARERVTAGLALVATDLQDPSHAVLWRADELLSPSSTAVAVHVLDDVSQDSEAAASRLREAVSALRRPTETSVVVGPSVAGAILGEARARHADLVVVGAHRRRAVPRGSRTDVCTDVLRGAKTSILVTPRPERDAWSPYT